KKKKKKDITAIAALLLTTFSLHPNYFATNPSFHNRCIASSVVAFTSPHPHTLHPRRLTRRRINPSRVHLHPLVCLIGFRLSLISHHHEFPRKQHAYGNPDGLSSELTF
ncbi:hypothetical protein L873DRAFT_1757180, partial [Choiromyces venosus 120613-1]